MQIKAVMGDITQQEVGAVIVNLFQGVQRPGGSTGAVDRALDGIISSLIVQGEIKGKNGEYTLIHTMEKIKPARVLVAGLGKQEEFTPEVVRQIMAGACRLLRNKGVQEAATIAHGAGIGGMDAATSAQAIAEGSLLGLYTFDRYQSKKTDDERGELRELLVVERDQKKVDDLNQGIELGRTFAQGAIMARDLVNEPANIMTPTEMAHQAQQVAQETGMEVEVLEQEEMEKLGMGALLAVASGSIQAPKLIVLTHNGDPDHPDNNLGLVGKGITFDSGGISLKPANDMWQMKGDMGGGAAVLGAMKAIGTLKPRINVAGIVASAENMPGGSAVRPGDIVKAMSGKSIEVDNTDAEGRMALADALCYAREKLHLRRLVDMATLTGAVITALGNHCTGVMGTHQELVDRLIQAGKLAGERLWQLPLWEEYKEQNKSTWADLKNTGGRGAGAITAAHFIAEFAEGAEWAHLDIAGTSMTDKEKGYLVKGGTGVPVRTLIHLALDLAKEG